MPTTATVDGAETRLAQQFNTPRSANAIVICNGTGLDEAFRNDTQFETIPEHLIDRLSVVEGAVGIHMTTIKA